MLDFQDFEDCIKAKTTKVNAVYEIQLFVLRWFEITDDFFTDIQLIFSFLI